MRPMVLRAALERMNPADRARSNDCAGGRASSPSFQFVAEVRNHGPSDLLFALSQLGAFGRAAGGEAKAGGPGRRVSGLRL